MEERRCISVLTLGMAFFSLAVSNVHAVECRGVVLYNELKDLRADPSKVAEVRELTLRRDAATFLLKEGKICLLRPIQGRVIGAVFTGEGAFTFVPPAKTESAQLRRFFHVDTLNSTINSLCLWFSDSTDQELIGNLSFKEGDVSPFWEQLDDAQKYHTAHENENLYFRLLDDLLSGRRSGFFYAHTGKHFGNPFFFCIDPGEDEEITLAHRPSHETREQEVVCQFPAQIPLQGSLGTGAKTEELLSVDHYQMDVRVGAGRLEATARASLRVQVDSLTTACFRLHPDLKINSVLSAQGDTLPFLKAKDDDELMVFFEPPLEKGERQIVFDYEGPIVERGWGGFYIKSVGDWYPRYGHHQRSTFDLTFRTPAQYKFVSVGQLVEKKREKNDLVTHWKLTPPSSCIAFNLGPFKVYEFKTKDLPPISVLTTAESKKDVGLWLLEEGILSAKSGEKDVAADVANSLALFTTLFGRCPASEIVATEIPFSYVGFSFPGLVYYDWTSLQLFLKDGTFELYRAHEVAHQWWGSAVGFKTYHDQWLSEGFAQYSGLMYVQLISKKNDLFFKFLNDWERELLRKRQYLQGKEDVLGSVSLGYRNSSSDNPDGYDLIVYRKGAFVLHMLRNLFLDLKNFNEDRFRAMMHEFYETYRGKNPSTEDFRGVVEKHLGEDMGWFFDEWVYGSSIPTYVFSYTIDKSPEGKTVAHCRVQQQDVPETFRMYVPITFKMPGGDEVRARKMIEGPATQFDVTLPGEPSKVVFNDYHSVLCKVVMK